ncbi:MAG: hypothetical protein KC656_02705 [Myxococcales bacterium]|nr:hypothetical protein [Myxococcales bacterium]
MTVTRGGLALGAVLLLGCAGFDGFDLPDPDANPPWVEPAVDPQPAVEPEPPGPPPEIGLLDGDLVVVPATRSDDVVIQYSDWRCPHCLVAYPKVRDAVREAGAELRFRNFPLSAPCNPGVSREDPERCTLALGSVCAYRQEGFEDFFERVQAGGDALAELPGDCLEDPGVAAVVREQAESGVALASWAPRRSSCRWMASGRRWTGPTR